ncbi:hypothetical protein Tco_0452170 [Tanacetum coccineum]
MWTYGITHNVPNRYKYNKNEAFQSASNAKDVFRVLLVLKLVLQLGSSVSLLMNPDSVDKNPKDVQLQNKDIMYDISSSVEIQKVYEFKRFLDKLNNDDVIAVPHKDAQSTLSDTNDPFTCISMSKDLVDKNIAANDAY